MTDFILEARDLELYSALTDNGAGGLSSSIGEMATQTNGAKIDLAKAHVKYPGLTPYELMISESQERMSVAVPSSKVEAFKKLAKKYSVQVSDIGEFTNSGVLEVYYDKKIVAHLDLHFLHEALPKMNLKARYQSFGLLKERNSWRKDLKDLYNLQTDSRVAKTKKKFSLDSLEEIIQTLLASPNIKSKEDLVRHYDHEVGASTLVKPFVGETGRAPSDGAVVWLHPHGGASDSAITVGIGMAPRLSLIDPYIMAQYSLDEAVRNIVASGADPEMVSLLDNFCWPDPVASEKNPDGEMKLGALVRSCYGMRELCLSYGMPLISGKDSMKNDYRGPNKKGEERVISVLPTLLITALGKADANHLTQTAINNDEQYLYILGPKLLRQSRSLLGSEFFEFFSLSNDDLKNEKMPLPIADEANHFLELYKSIFEARKSKLFSTLHDISDGGAIIALVEKVMGVNLGLNLDFSYASDDEMARELFNEAPGRFVVSVSKTKKDQFENFFKNHDLRLVGETANHSNVVLKCQNKTFNMNKASFESAFGGGF
jgi:phosphoribosylformylglycinamidine (FGAM) synthase-like enzyme